MGQSASKKFKTKGENLNRGNKSSSAATSAAGNSRHAASSSQSSSFSSNSPSSSSACSTEASSALQSTPDSPTKTAPPPAAWGVFACCAKDENQSNEWRRHDEDGSDSRSQASLELMNDGGRDQRNESIESSRSSELSSTAEGGKSSTQDEDNIYDDNKEASPNEEVSPSTFGGSSSECSSPQTASSVAAVQTTESDAAGTEAAPDNNQATAATTETETGVPEAHQSSLSFPPPESEETRKEAESAAKREDVTVFSFIPEERRRRMGDVVFTYLPDIPPTYQEDNETKEMIRLESAHEKLNKIKKIRDRCLTNIENEMLYMANTDAQILMKKADIYSKSIEKEASQAPNKDDLAVASQIRKIAKDYSESTQNMHLTKKMFHLQETLKMFELDKRFSSDPSTFRLFKYRDASKKSADYWRGEGKEIVLYGGEDVKQLGGVPLKFVHAKTKEFQALANLFEEETKKDEGKAQQRRLFSRSSSKRKMKEADGKSFDWASDAAEGSSSKKMRFGKKKIKRVGSKGSAEYIASAAKSATPVAAAAAVVRAATMQKHPSKAAPAIRSLESIAMKEAEVARNGIRNLSESGWSIEQEDKVLIAHKLNSNGSVSVQLNVVMRVVIFRVLAILNEIDSYDKWVPYCKNCNKIAQTSRASMLLQQICEYPWPIKQKETMSFCYGVDALDEYGSMFINSVGLDENLTEFMGIRIPPPSKKIPRVASSQLLFILSPMAGGRCTSLEVFANIDPGITTLRSVLAPVIKIVVVRTVKGFFHKIQALANNFEANGYQQKVDANPAIYSMIQDRTARLLLEIRDGEEESEETLMKRQTCIRYMVQDRARHDPTVAAALAKMI